MRGGSQSWQAGTMGDHESGGLSQAPIIVKGWRRAAQGSHTLVVGCTYISLRRPTLIRSSGHLSLGVITYPLCTQSTQDQGTWQGTRITLSSGLRGHTLTLPPLPSSPLSRAGSLPSKDIELSPASPPPQLLAQGLSDVQRPQDPGGQHRCAPPWGQGI